MAEVQKTADQAEQTSVKKTPEAAAVSGVIGGQPNQEIHGQASSIAHANDKTLSEPDMIAMGENETPAEYKARVAQIQANRFGFYDSDAEAGTKVFEKPAKQAVEPMPALTPVLSEGPYDSTVKLNVQITNVPEVSEGVKPEELLQYTDTMLQSGAQVVRQIERHMAEPNAINNDMANMAAHFSQSPYQLNKDVQVLFNAAMDQIDHPVTIDERAKAAGNLMPMFFFEGNAVEPISPQTVEQMGLETLSQEELNSLGISRSFQETADFHMPEIPEHLKNLEFPPMTQGLVQSMEGKGRTIIIGEPGSRVWSDLETVGANAKVIYPWCDEIMVKSNAPRVALLEEFLHGTQQKIGLLDIPEMPRHLPEIHVKDFMLRHSKMLGLTENEITLLEELKERAINGLNQEGYRWTGR